MDGRGIYRWADGRTLEGQFRNNKANGYGVLRNPSGKVEYEGEWIDFQPAKKVE